MSQQTGPTGPCGLTIKANNYEAWGFKIQDKGRGDPDSPFTVLLHESKKIEIASPEGSFYPTTRNIFKYNSRTKYWEQIDKFGRVNEFRIEHFLQCPEMIDLLTDRNTCSSIDFVNKVNGKQITMEDAVLAVQDYSPDNKPVLTLPGPSTFTQSAPRSASRTSASASSSVSTHSTPQKPTDDVSTDVSTDDSGNSAGPPGKRRRR